MKKWAKILTGILVLISVGVLIGYFYINKPHPDYETMEAKYKLKARELYDIFYNSPKIASGTYNGKIIQITGTPDNIETTDSLVIAVFAYNKGMFGDEGIRCIMLPDYNDIKDTFSPGQKISLKGFCSGYNDTDVILEKCSIIK